MAQALGQSWCYTVNKQNQPRLGGIYSLLGAIRLYGLEFSLINQNSLFNTPIMDSLTSWFVFFETICNYFYYLLVCPWLVFSDSILKFKLQVSRDPVCFIHGGALGS